MARTKAPVDVPPQIPNLDPDTIERGVAKLKKRLEDVRSLQVAALSENDQRVENAEQAIRRDILEIYGANSLHYRQNEHFQIWDGTVPINASIQRIRAAYGVGLQKAVALLEGLIRDLEERRAAPEVDPKARAQRTFGQLDLHPRIAAVAQDLYRDRHYSSAILNSCLALANFVKEKSGRHDIDGANLMRTVFSPKAPLLAFNGLANDSDRDEQEGMMHLFEGVVQAFRNPRAHEVVPDSAEYALSAIAFLSMLACRLDGARRTSQG